MEEEHRREAGHREAVRKAAGRSSLRWRLVEEEEGVGRRARGRRGEGSRGQRPGGRGEGRRGVRRPVAWGVLLLAICFRSWRMDDVRLFCWSRETYWFTRHLLRVGVTGERRELTRTAPL